MNGWTPQRRRRQSELIRQWRPWEKSTGPRTPAGKVRAANNAHQGGTRPMLRALSRTLGGHREWLGHHPQEREGPGAAHTRWRPRWNGT